MGRSFRFSACACVVALGCAVPSAAADIPASTPEELVAAYSSLADSIIATNETERNLVHSILAMTYRHARGAMAAARAEMEQGRTASEEIESLASLVSQLGNEGDASVAAIRKRLVEEGHHHHHHAKAEEDTGYDPGFVIVDREAKKAFLNAAGAIAKLAGSTDAAALKSEWKKVEELFAKLRDDAKM